MNTRSKGTLHLTLAALCAVLAMALLTPSQAYATSPLYYSFVGGTGGNTDGSYPFAGFVIDSSGNLYGTTTSGGTHNQGTAFEITSAGTYCKIYDFGATGDGITPEGDFILDSAGNLYGTASGGGSHGLGLVFALSPPMTSCTTWTETKIYNFGDNNPHDGNAPYGRLLLKSGIIYGTTTAGGTSSKGTVFKLSVSGGTWTETKLHDFAGGATDGQLPYGGLVMDSNGILYGTTYNGGASVGSGGGTMYQINTDGTGFGLDWTFGGTGDGTNPWDTLLVDNSNNLYGTTSTGGANGYGIVFQLSPPVSPSTTWTETPYSFKASADGIEPYDGLFVDASGNAWITTPAGGASGNSGAIVKLTLSGGIWSEAVKYTFTGGTTDCSSPRGDLVMDSSGNLWGTAFESGANSYGCVFKYTP